MSDLVPEPLRHWIRRARKNELAWRYLYNCVPTVAYSLRRQKWTPEGRRIVTDLNRYGIATTTVDRLMGCSTLYRELEQAVGERQHQLAYDLGAARNRLAGGAVGQKTFIVPLLGQWPVFDPDSAFAKFSLQSPILQISNAYFGMYTRLRYYNVWQTLVSQGEARESQLWHHDREDYLILKMFVYLSDVDESAGPFTYARGTHRKGNVRCQPPAVIEGGVLRSTDCQMATLVPSQQWFQAIGPRGTIVFADTSGLHKGGHAKGRERVLYTSMFTSQASESEEFLDKRLPGAETNDTELAFALSTPGRRPGSSVAAVASLSK